MSTNFALTGKELENQTNYINSKKIIKCQN